MEPIKLKAVLTATAGEFFGDESLLEKEIYDISTNSREIGDNCLFIPLAGEKFDGHNFDGIAYYWIALENVRGESCAAGSE